MTKLEKAYRKLSAFERSIVDTIYKKLFRRDFWGLNIKKLTGFGDYYRVRKGKVRIIYQDKNGLIEIKALSLRNSKTYKNI